MEPEEKVLINKIRNTKNYHEILMLQEELNALVHDRHVKAIKEEIKYFVPSGYKLYSEDVNPFHPFQFLFIKDLKQKLFVCVKNGTDSYSLLQVVNPHTTYSYHMNGQSGRNTKEIKTIKC